MEANGPGDRPVEIRTVSNIETDFYLKVTAATVIRKKDTQGNVTGGA